VSAANANSVALELTGCAAPPEADVRAIAALELRGRLVEGSDAAADQRVTVTCTGDRAELRTSARSEVRTIDLGSVPAPLRARLVALSIAELSSVPRAEPELVPPGQDAAAPPLASTPTERPPTTVAAHATRPSFSGWLAAGAKLTVVRSHAQESRVSSGPMLAAAGAVSALQHVVGPLAWTGELALGQARHDIDGGRLRVRSVVLRSGPALVLARPRALWHTGLAVRLELLELAGEPSDRSLWRGASVRTFVAGPALFAGVALPLGRHLTLALEGELAHQLRAVDVEVIGGSASTLSPWRAALDVLVGARW